MMATNLSFPSKPPVWLVVASGKSARVFRVRRTVYDRPSSWTRKHPLETESRALVLEPVPNLALEEEPRDAFQLGQSEHTQTPYDPVTEEIKDDLAKRIAQELESAAARQEFDRLLLAAPPRLLGKLKRALGAMVLARLCGEIPKDVSKHGPKDEALIARVTQTLAAARRP